MLWLSRGYLGVLHRTGINHCEYGRLYLIKNFFAKIFSCGLRSCESFLKSNLNKNNEFSEDIAVCLAVKCGGGKNQVRT
jgi:hypothetical protein